MGQSAEERLQQRSASSNHILVDPPHRTASGALGDVRALTGVLGLLARAVQQVHTYPSASPLCVAAIETCHEALVNLEPRTPISFRVTPSSLVIDDQEVGGGTLIEHELATRLHRAAVAAVRLDREVTAREIGRFCEVLVAVGAGGAAVPLAERLADHGVAGVIVTMASRPEVIEIGAVGDQTVTDLARARTRFDASVQQGDGVTNHLYPPQKGWVRVDPAAAPAMVSLLELAVLADDPVRLASMLLRLTDLPAEGTAGEALRQKYSDVTRLLSALDSGIAHRMFSKLASAVLSLDPAERQALLRQTVLPGLLERRIDGAILRHFPDMDLAEALGLLLDLETAAPELLRAALAGLELSSEREAALAPLLETQLDARRGAADDGRQRTLLTHARALVAIEGDATKSFADFAVFDLAIDDETTAALAHMRSAVAATDVLTGRLTCLWHLTSLEPNPDQVRTLLSRAFVLLGQLEQTARGSELPAWLGGYRAVADRLRDPRPDVAAAVAAELERFCSVERAAWLADVSVLVPDGRQTASALITASGAPIAGALVSVIEKEQRQTDTPSGRSSAALALLADHCSTFADAWPALLAGRTPAVTRQLLRILASADAGMDGIEEAIARHVTAGHEGTARDALRALARIGSHRAARLVVGHLTASSGWLALAAEEALWHFPPRSCSATCVSCWRCASSPAPSRTPQHDSSIAPSAPVSISGEC